MLLLEKVSGIENKLETYNKRLEAAETNISAQNKIIENQNKQIKKQDEKILQLEKVVERVYSEQSKNNLVIRGLRSKTDSDLKPEIVNHFCQLGAKHPPTIQQSHKIGKNVTHVTFSNYSDKMFLLTKSRQLLDAGVKVEEDLTPRQRQEKNMLLKQRRELLDNGVATTVKLHKNSLLLDDTDWFDFDRNSGLMTKRYKK